MRLTICEDSVLLREGLIRLLTEVGHEVVAALPDAVGLMDSLACDPPDFCILDVRLPPTFTDEGVRAALQVRERYPELPVLVLLPVRGGALRRGAHRLQHQGAGLPAQGPGG